MGATKAKGGTRMAGKAVSAPPTARKVMAQAYDRASQTRNDMARQGERARMEAQVTRTNYPR